MDKMEFFIRAHKVKREATMLNNARTMAMKDERKKTNAFDVNINTLEHKEIAYYLIWYLTEDWEYSVLIEQKLIPASFVFEDLSQHKFKLMFEGQMKVCRIIKIFN